MNAVKTLPVTIRPFEEKDYPARLAVLNASYPDRPLTLEVLHELDRSVISDPKYLHRQVVADVGGQAVGYLWYGHWEFIYHPKKPAFSLAVHPAYRNLGIGSSLYRAMEEGIAPLEPVLVACIALENQPEGLRFLERRGFKVRMSFWESELDLPSFEFAPFEAAGAHALPPGMRIVTERELLARDQDYERKLYEMVTEIEADVPAPDQMTPPTFERFLERRRDSKVRNPDSFFLAVDEKTGDYAGITMLFKLPGRPYVNTGLTGVRRAYRRRGIALALKLHAIRYAREQGETAIRTDNESNNRAMLSLNERLGFRRGTVEFDMYKGLREEP